MPIRWSWPIARRTSSTSAPSFSQRPAISLINEILVANMQFEAYLAISALSGDMTNNFLLMPNDVIYVQANPLAKMGLGVQTLLLPIRPAAETVRAPASAAAAMGG